MPIVVSMKMLVLTKNDRTVDVLRDIFFRKPIFTFRGSHFKCSVIIIYVIIIAFWNESTLYSCLNVKELLVPSRREIWSFGDSNGIRIYCCDNDVLRIWILKGLLKGFPNSLKIPVNVEFIINTVAFLLSITLLKNKFFRRYFSRNLWKI